MAETQELYFPEPDETRELAPLPEQDSLPDITRDQAPLFEKDMEIMLGRIETELKKTFNYQNVRNCLRLLRDLTITLKNHLIK